MKKVGHSVFLIFVWSAMAIAACSNPHSSDAEGTTPLTIPSDIENNCIGFLTYSNTDFATIHSAGAAWARPHPGPFAWGWIEVPNGTFDFSDADEVVTAAQASTVAILGTVWPFADWDQSACHDAASCEVSTNDQFYPGKGKDGGGANTGIPASRCAPCSMDDYKEFLTRLAERYDGDGTDDMVGLTIPVKYWEILNEPEMNSDDLTLIFYVGLVLGSFSAPEGQYSQVFADSVALCP